jgi:hypothetical protein
VVVTICYSGGNGLRPYFLTAAKRIKDSFPDIVIEKLILPSREEGGDDGTFEVLVDGKVVINRTRANRSSNGGGGSSGSGGGSGTSVVASLKSVFVSLSTVEAAIHKARRRRRPSSTVYDVEVPAVVSSSDDIRVNTSSLRTNASTTIAVSSHTGKHKNGSSTSTSTTTTNDTMMNQTNNNNNNNSNSNNAAAVRMDAWRRSKAASSGTVVAGAGSR